MTVMGGGMEMVKQEGRRGRTILDVRVLDLL
jgi:hypothetical protein